MNVSGSRPAEDINLDEFERRLRAAGAQQPSAEDPLLELARLIESSRFGSTDSGPPARAAVESAGAEAKAAPPIENEPLRPAIDEAADFIPAASEADRDARQDYEAPIHPSHDANPAGEAAEARPKGWMLKVSALALAGVAMIGAVIALKGGAPGLSRDPPFIAAAQGPTKVQPPSDETAAASNDAGGSLLKDNAKPASVKVISSEEQPVDLSAEASIGNSSAAQANPPGAADLAKSPAGGLAVTPVAATVDTPLVPPAAAAPPAPTTSEFPAPKPVRTVSLRPDGTPIAAANPLDQSGLAATPAAAPAQSPPAAAPTQAAPGKLAPKAASDAAGVAQPSTPKIDLPTKLSPKSSARVVVAKTDTTAPDATAQTPSAPAAPVKPAPKKPKPDQTQADATETPAAPAAAANATPPVDATAATASGGWAVQLAAPKSEAEASSEMARLNSKYGADLNGSALGVHKAVVNGETIYRLRVVGLTKADAAALCARLKGDGGACFIAK
jgi:hypothetical protein